MAIPITICDDSAFARKQLARALPKDWDIEVHYAEHGAAALDNIRAGKADILFLDLTMPVMDGFETLDVIRNQNLNCLTIVVSGDVQPEAYKRVRAKGAVAFIRKPVDFEKLTTTLRDYGIFDAVAGPPDAPRNSEGEGSLDYCDWYQELTNIAMGRAGELLGQVLRMFVTLSVPRVRILSRSHLPDLLDRYFDHPKSEYVAQGFIGRAVGGEALISLAQEDLDHLVRLMDLHQANRTEGLMELSGMLLGAFLTGLGELLDLHFSENHPTYLGSVVQARDILHQRNDSEQVMAIEIDYCLDEAEIGCKQLLLFTGKSLARFGELSRGLLD